jgi:hypothetical protein
MYAQTITYGLLSARVSRPAGLVAENIADMVPVTNPFLRDLLSTFLTVGDRNPQEDPVVHFYELFLKEYDPKKRIQRGVTPRRLPGVFDMAVRPIPMRRRGRGTLRPRRPTLRLSEFTARGHQSIVSGRPPRVCPRIPAGGSFRRGGSMWPPGSSNGTGQPRGVPLQ